MIELRVHDQRGVTLFDALWAFYQEHEYCGELDRHRGRPGLDDVYVWGGDH